MVTRDAKIGMLVGLAFVLIVGILLSEHITSATTPPQAELAKAGAKVREASATPTAPQPKVANLKIDPNPQPTQSVVTRDQLDSPRLPPTARIQLDRPERGEIRIIRVDSPDPVASAVAVRSDSDTSTPPTRSEIAAASDQPRNNLPSALVDVARQNGMELLALDTTRTNDERRTAPLDSTGESAAMISNGTKVKEYIAQAGDSLSRIASRQLGANTPANQSAIIALNPSLQKDANRILAGGKYLIPADAWAAAMGPGNDSRPEAKPDEERRDESTTIVYEVKAGDSLWKIAEREIGNANAVARIKELNTEVLGESDIVKVGMKLKLPTKQG